MDLHSIIVKGWEVDLGVSLDPCMQNVQNRHWRLPNIIHGTLQKLQPTHYTRNDKKNLTDNLQKTDSQS